MSVPVKHHSKGKVGRRRSHLALKQTSLQACTECKAPILPHRVCGFCGAVQTRATRGERKSAPARVKRAAPAAAAAEPTAATEDVAAATEVEAPVVADAPSETDEPAAEETA